MLVKALNLFKKQMCFRLICDDGKVFLHFCAECYSNMRLCKNIQTAAHFEYLGSRGLFDVVMLFQTF